MLKAAVALPVTWQMSLLYAVAFGGFVAFSTDLPTYLKDVYAFEPPLEVPADITFVVLAFFLGLGAGGVFAWVARQAPPERVGTVTGLVGAAGGFGGYFPPLVMGATYEILLPGWGVGLTLLAIVALAALAFTYLGIKTARAEQAPA